MILSRLLTHPQQQFVQDWPETQGYCMALDVGSLKGRRHVSQITAEYARSTTTVT